MVARSPGSPGSPGSCPYRFTSRDSFAESPADFPGRWFLPGLRAFAGREHTLPIGAHGLYALIAPRRCMIHTAHHDGAEPTFAVERGYLAGREVYRLLGAADNLRVIYRPGQHGPITDAHRRQNLDWFDLSFGRGDARQEDFAEDLIHDFDWQAWRHRSTGDAAEPRIGEGATIAQLRAVIRWMLGHPDGTPEPASDAEFLSAEESAMMPHDRWSVDGVRRVPIRLGEGVRGNVYLPASTSDPLPVVVWLHPYSYHSGYNEGFGVQGTTIYHRLAAAGHAVIAYDQCGFGLRLLEGRGFCDRNPDWSRLGRMVHDARAAVDFMIEGRGATRSPLPEFDTNRITLLGYAVGGLVALHAAALDDRVTAVAAYSPMTPWRDQSAARATGGTRRRWSEHALLPRLGLFAQEPSETPYDLGDLLTLIGPRPTLLVTPQDDRFAEVDAVRKEVERVRAAASASGLTFRQPKDTNRFQEDQHETFLRWMSRAAFDAGR